MTTKEKAISWFNNQSMEYKDSINWPEVMRGTKNEHCIEVLYKKQTIINQ